MPDQTVEIERRRGAGVNLVVPHLRFAADGPGHFLGDAGGRFQCRALRGLEDELKLRLVVEGKHLDGHRTEQDEPHGGQQQGDDADQEGPAPAGVVEQRTHHPMVQPCRPVAGCMIVVTGCCCE